MADVAARRQVLAKILAKILVRILAKIMAEDVDKVLDAPDSACTHVHANNRSNMRSNGALFFCPRANLPYCSWCFTVTYERTMWQTQGFSCPLLWSLGSH